MYTVSNAEFYGKFFRKVYFENVFFRDFQYSMTSQYGNFEKYIFLMSENITVNKLVTFKLGFSDITCIFKIINKYFFLN